MGNIWQFGDIFTLAQDDAAEGRAGGRGDPGEAHEVSLLFTAFAHPFSPSRFAYPFSPSRFGYVIAVFFY